jgi:hypothetical protein
MAKLPQSIVEVDKIIHTDIWLLVYEFTPEDYEEFIYEEFIGAKKHLVLGVSPHTGAPQRSNSFAIG